MQEFRYILYRYYIVYIEFSIVIIVRDSKQILQVVNLWKKTNIIF